MASVVRATRSLDVAIDRSWGELPISLVYAGYANPTIWIVAFVGLALRFAWPGALILLKPSLFPFALIGIRSRGWWLCALVLAIASLPFLAETLIYPMVILDTQGGGLLYSALGIPLMLVPIVVWLGRTRGSAAPR